MSFITKSNNAGYVNVSAPWSLGQWPKEQTEEEKEAFKKALGANLIIIDNIKQVLEQIAKPVYIPNKGASYNESVSKVLQFYIDSHANQNTSEREKTIQLNEMYNKKYGQEIIGKGETKHQAHIELDTYRTIDQIKDTLFRFPPTTPYGVTNYIHEEAVLQVCIKYYLENNTRDKKQSTTITKKIKID